jgi:hypothetical protein
MPYQFTASVGSSYVSIPPANRKLAADFSAEEKSKFHSVRVGLGSRYRSGRSKDWLKLKNPDAPAVKREAEEEWGE